jgi:hypothetical protein
MPRVAKLMALAIAYDDLLRTGVVQSLAELARLGHVSTTRMTHIMNLLLLAPEIQEWLLFLPPVEKGPDPLFLKDLQPIARQLGWQKQRTADLASLVRRRQAEPEPSRQAHRIVGGC